MRPVLVLLSVILLAIAAPARAQTDTPKPENIEVWSFDWAEYRFGTEDAQAALRALHGGLAARKEDFAKAFRSERPDLPGHVADYAYCAAHPQADLVLRFAGAVLGADSPEQLTRMLDFARTYRQQQEEAIAASAQDFPAGEADGGFAREVLSRAAREQGLRKAAQEHGYFRNSEDHQALAASLFNRMGCTDWTNTEWLKEQVAARGWPTISEYGEMVSQAAWLIVQHSPDDAFQARMLALMEPLAREGEVTPPRYALLYDRVTLQSGGQQRYGSQINCVDGRPHARNLEDPDTVDARRAEMGLGPFEDYLARFEELCARN